MISNSHAAFWPSLMAFSNTERMSLVKGSNTKDSKLNKTKFTDNEAVDVWLRSWSGQYQHQIAAAYEINVRAVNHVLKEKTHVGSKQVAASKRSA